MQVSAWLTRHLVAVLSWLWIATAGLAFGDPYIRLLLQGCNDAATADFQALMDIGYRDSFRVGIGRGSSDRDHSETQS